MNVNDIEPTHPAPAFRGCLFALLLTGIVIGAVQVALVAGCASAPELPEGAIEFVTNYVDRIISGAGGASSDRPSDVATEEGCVVSNPGGDAGDAAEPEIQTTEHTEHTEDPAPDSAPAIAWKYGGVDGSKAKEDPATQIRDLKISGDGLSYAWAKGDLSNWGLSETDAGALACAFWWDGSRWVGGKFDWISTSRTTRDFKNIRDGYHGWNPDAFFGAKRRAFCILSKDGKRRTNILEETR